MSNLPNFPTIRPSLLLDFANSKQVDPRISFTRASTATYFDGKGVMRTAASGVPRIDHDPVTGECKGLLIEEQRTNLFTYSEQFDNAAWMKQRGSVTPDVITAPYGTLTADKFVEGSENGHHYIYQQRNVEAGVTYTLSVYVKSAERTRVRLQFFSTNGGFETSTATFDIANGTVVDSADVNSATIADVGGGWYRISVTETAIATALSPVAITLDSTGITASYTGDGTSGIYIWGAQFEAGAFPTSYIPTTSASATRAADVASMTGANFSEWYRQDEGAFVVSSSPYAGMAPVDRRIFTASDGTTNNRVGALYSGSGFNATIVSSGGVFQYGPADAAISSTPAVRALAYKAGDIRAAINGSLSAASSGSVVVPVGVNRLQLGAMGASGHLNGYIARLAYYPKRLTNAELQALTA